jgi:hypothetical protein
MGMGSLKRIAAHSFLATVAVFAMGALTVSALTVPGTQVAVPATTVTVQTPTVRVPSTAPKPPPAPKVTAPAPAPVKVTPPKLPSPAPVVKKVTQPVTNAAPKVTKTVQAAPKAVSKPVSKTTGTVNKVAPKATNTVKTVTGGTSKTVGSVTKPGGGGGGSKGSGSGGGPSGPTGPVTRIIGTVTGGLGGTTGGTSRSGVATLVGGSSSAAGSGNAVLVRGADGRTYLAVPGGSAGGPGGGSSTGGGIGGFGTGPGGTAAGGGGSLAAMLAGASPKQLRSVLSHLEGCLPELPAIDRRVISMRAGLNGTPLTRPEVGAKLGLSRQAVRNTEQRALNRLQYAAANTGCAGTVVGPFDAAGIGNLMPQLLSAGPVPVNMSSGAFTAAGSNAFQQARGIVSRTAQPLVELGEGGGGGPAWAIILFTVLFSVSIAALTRELRHSF